MVRAERAEPGDRSQEVGGELGDLGLKGRLGRDVRFCGCHGEDRSEQGDVCAV